MEEKAKRILHVEINDDVRKLTIEGTDKEQQVVMRQELEEDELDNVAGGNYAPTFSSCTSFVTCRAATDTRGSRCNAYRFL
jgi:dissimilatory sulfite reductase (desulfoviridin) alpha/beta subunit